MKRMVWGALAMVTLGVVAISPRIDAQTVGRARPAATAAAPRPWYSVTVVDVKRDMVDEWIEFQKTQTIPMQQKGGIAQRDVWQGGAPVGESFSYAIVAPIGKFADYDMEPLAQRVLGPDGYRSYVAQIRRLVASSHTYAIQALPEMSITPNPAFKPKAGVLTVVTVVSGHAESYEWYLKNEFVPVLKRGKSPGFLVSRQIFGGAANEYETMQLLDSYSQIDKGPIAARVLGEAAAQELNLKAAPHIASVRRELLRYVPDLSFSRKPTT